MQVVDLADIRRLVIIAMFSDDVLFEKLVLKGGNAVSLVYRYGARGSLDVDFSIDGEFEDVEDAAKRISKALADGKMPPKGQPRPSQDDMTAIQNWAKGVK